MESVSPSPVFAHSLAPLQACSPGDLLGSGCAPRQAASLPRNEVVSFQVLFLLPLYLLYFSSRFWKRSS